MKYKYRKKILALTEEVNQEIAEENSEFFRIWDTNYWLPLPPHVLEER